MWQKCEFDGLVHSNRIFASGLALPEGAKENRKPQMSEKGKNGLEKCLFVLRLREVERG